MPVTTSHWPVVPPTGDLQAWELDDRRRHLYTARAHAMRALGLPHPWAPGSAASREATLGALRFFAGLASVPSIHRHRPANAS